MNKILGIVICAILCIVVPKMMDKSEMKKELEVQKAYKGASFSSRRFLNRSSSFTVNPKLKSAMEASRPVLKANPANKPVTRVIPVPIPVVVAQKEPTVGSPEYVRNSLKEKMGNFDQQIRDKSWQYYQENTK